MRAMRMKNVFSYYRMCSLTAYTTQDMKLESLSDASDEDETDRLLRDVNNITVRRMCPLTIECVLLECVLLP
jgi:hypothetical protein